MAEMANTQSTNFFAGSNNTTLDPSKLTSELRPKTAVLAPSNTFINTANRTGEQGQQLALAAMLEDRKQLIDERVGISSMHFGDNSANFKR